MGKWPFFVGGFFLFCTQSSPHAEFPRGNFACGELCVLLPIETGSLCGGAFSV